MSDGDELRAFERFFALTRTGVKTSVAMRSISDELGVSVRTLYSWKKRGDWDRRCVERSVEVNERLKGLLSEESDSFVGDFRRPFIEILNGLVEACVSAGEVRISNIRELVSVIELSTRLQRELDLGNARIVSSDYSHEKHMDEINSVLRRLSDDGAVKAREEARAKHESGLRSVEVSAGG